MPYVVIRGEVHNGADRYYVGDVVPSDVADDGMVAAGGIEWREDVPAGYAEMTNRELRDLIASRGVKPPVVANKAQLVALLEAEDERTEEALEA
jgi:hypothetical protein